MSVMRSILLQMSQNKTATRAARKYGLRMGAERFVAGETLEAAIKKVRELNGLGLMATLDHLGEFVSSESEANAAAKDVVRAIEDIGSTGVNSNVSVKLTQLGLDISYELCRNNMRTIVSKAKQLGNFIRIDMEDYTRNEPAITMFKELRAEFGCHVGIVLQAYLYKTESDMERLHPLAPNYRLVKGAYQESSDVAFPFKVDVDHNFIHIIEKQLQSGHYAAIATHDEQIINHVKAYASKNGIPNSQFEFQMLFGIRTQLQQQLAGEGYAVRVYVPYGMDWYGYFMRRLAERPENLNFVLKSMFRR
ncbi:proline dehydrogenase family protein [Paenibacillus beijingensis]|uniref:proline dehydrogenase n=1 Tax=Paenibacillus beijingensis TaxID=1126833 RepID=A0A0D5NND2_9BACL|nr:proline dehydrogenase family protein [Paenibacillus beijingensis]AJY76814.1 proline dehydrogenase [Paenibacillus beijingensis]